LPHAGPSKTGAALKPLGDGFIQLIKMMIAPVIFCTIVHGIASMRDLAKVGRVGVKALLYFEVVSTLALAIGLIVGELLHPGAGFNIDASALDPKAVSGYVTRAKEEGVVAHILAIIPNTFFDAFAKGDLLQVLLVSLLTGFAVSRMGALGERITLIVEAAAQVFFRIIAIIVRAAPIGALGAMAFTIGAYGLGSLFNLAALIATFYITAILFVVLVLGAIARLAGFSILRFVAYIRDELLIVLGTHLGDRAAAHDAEDEASGRLGVGGRAGDPGRLQLQPGRHQHLHDACDAVPRPGDEHAAHARPGAHHPRGRHAARSPTWSATAWPPCG
jgi:aerobic C4-dicarboxylate transport protein